MPLRGLSQRNPPMETLRQQAGRRQPGQTDLEIRGDNWCERRGAGSFFVCVLLKIIVHVKNPAWNHAAWDLKTIDLITVAFNLWNWGLKFELFTRLNTSPTIPQHCSLRKMTLNKKHFKPVLRNHHMNHEKLLIFYSALTRHIELSCFFFMVFKVSNSPFDFMTDLFSAKM